MPGKKGTHNCKVCRHPQRTEIEVALAEGVPYPRLVGQFWVDPEAVRYHVLRTARLQAGESTGEGTTPP